MAGKKRPPAEEPVALEDEEAFPRGGRDDLTPLEKRQLSQQAEADFKQEQHADAAGAKPKKKAKHSKEQDAEGAFFSRSAAAGKVQHVEQLKYKTLAVGMKLWGCVLEVAPEGLTVSLPHGLRGSVAAEDASDVLALLLDTSSKRGAALRSTLPDGEVPNLQQLFSVGQYVRCVIKSLQDGAAEGGAGKSKGSKRIVLSLRLKSLLGSGASSSADGLVVGQVVPAVVRTVEDRGYSLSLGIKGVSAFLPAKDFQTYYPDSPLLPGSLLDVITTKAPATAAAGAAVYQVSVSYDAVSGAQLQPWDGLNMANLLPGWLVSCKVRQVCADGLLVSFGGYFHASIDHFHLANPIPEEDWQKRYPVGQKLQARLIYIDPASKRIGLSCLPHLINCRLPTAVPAMGQVFDSAVVARIDSGLGLLLRLPTEPESAVGFAHVSNLSDGKLEKADVAKRFSVGGTVRGRVIGFRLMDALVAMSLKESVLAQQVYSVKDLYPGQVLDVTVLDHIPAGLVVQITQNLKGLVPKTHMTDAGVLAEGAKLPSKLQPGKTLQARVLSVDAVHKKVQLTLKKGLLGSKLPVLCDVRQAAIGMKLHGVVTGVQKFGVYVGFYGGVSGLMPKPNLDLLPGQEPGDVYSVGQLLRVQVASVDLRKGGLVLRRSVKRSAEAEEQAPTVAAAAGDPWGGLAVGSLIAAGGVVQQVLARAPEQGGGLIELTVTGADGQPLLAHLPATHLSDHPGGVEGLMSVLKPGMTLPGPLLVLQQRMLNPSTQGSDRWQADEAQDPKPQHGGEGGAEGKAATPLVLVSRKGSMVAAAEKLPSSVSEVVADAVLPGYVASVTRDAVFVRYLGRCTGRAGLPQLADTFVTDPACHFTVGQSVIASVVAVDDGKFAVSLKPSVVGSQEGQFLASLMSDLELAYQLSQAAEAAAAAEAGSDDDAAAEVDWSLFPIGKTVGATLNELKEYGAVMDLEDNLDVVGLIVPDHGGNEKLQGAGRVEPCVLDVHKTQGLVELSLLPELTHLAAAAASGSSKKASKKKAAAATGDEQQQQQQPPTIGSDVQAMIHFVKDHYVVASIVQQQQQQKGKKAAAESKQQQQYKHLGIAFIARGDFNSQGSAGREARRFSKGQVVAARVAAAAAPENGGRVLLELAQPLVLPGKGPKGTAAGGAAAAASGTSKPSAGSLVTATVVAVHDIELECAVGKAGTTAHLHVAECQERLTDVPKPQNPLSQFRVQQQITAAWLGHVKGLGHKRGKEPQLSVRASAVAAAKTHGTQQPGASSAKPKIAAVLSAAELHPGLKVVGWVCGFTKDALWLSLAPELKGRVHVLESGDKPQALTVDFESRFSMGQALEAVVLGVDPKHHTLDLSLRADRLRRAVADPATGAAAGAAAAVEVPEGGALVPGRIVSVAGSGVVIQLGSKLHGIVSLTDIHDDWVPNALAGLSAGSFVRARVLVAANCKPSSAAKPSPALVDSKERVLLSLRPSDGGLVAGAADSSAAAAAVSKKQQQYAAGVGGPVLQQEQLKVGNKVQGYVRSVSTKGLFVVLDRQHDARIKLSQLSDGFVEDPAAAFPVGSRVEGRVVSLEHTKPPVAEGAAVAAAAAAAAAADDDGLRVELSLRSGEGSRGLRTIADISEGELTTGKVRRVEKYGVFVELARSRVSGLVHISQVGQGFVKDLASHYSPGQIVSVRVLSVDKENNKVSLSMKPELLVDDGSDEEGQEADKQQRKGLAGKQGKSSGDFDDEMLEAMDVEESEGEEARESEGDEEGSELDDAAASDDDDVDLDDMDITDEGEEQSDDAEEEGSENEDSEEQADSDAGSEEDGSSESEQEGSETESEEVPLLQPAAAAADWGELQLLDGAAADGQEATANGSAELTRGEKKRLKAAREAEVRAAEAARLAGGEQPESVASYEQQLLAEPNSSFLWVKYMAYQLKLGEVDAARKVAERALNTIAMTSERDKFNVWVALMNLENAYAGSNAEDAVMAVFKRAVQYCDPKPLYLALLGILERSGRWQLANEVWRTATKKFNQSCKVWLGAFESALQAANRAAAAEDDGQPSSSSAATAAGDAAAARHVLERALKSLPKRKHIKALMRAALAEFRLGCAERGRSMLESMLANYPKRTDIWNVYIDQEIKAGDAARTRSLLARATSLSLNPKKMKVLFRRWLEYEQAHGTAADVAAVKQLAVEYMESQALAGGA